MNCVNSCHVLNIKERIAVSPEHMRKEKVGIDVRRAVKHVYGRELMSFSNKFRGVPLHYKNVKCFCSRAPMMDDDWRIYLDVQLELTVFRPRLGDILEGVVNKLSPGGRHVGLLAHNFFNISAVKNDNWNGDEVEIGQIRRVKITGITSHRSTLQIRGNLLPSLAAATADDEDDDGGCEKKKKKKSNHKSPNKSNQFEDQDTIILETDTESILNGSSGDIQKKKKKKKKNKADDDGGDDIRLDGDATNIAKTVTNSTTNIVEESTESHHGSFKVPKPPKRRNESFAGVQEIEFSPEVSRKKKKKRLSSLT